MFFNFFLANELSQVEYRFPVRYLCLFAHSGVQHVLCCFVLFFFVVWCQFLWIVHFLLFSNVYSIWNGPLFCRFVSTLFIDSENQFGYLSVQSHEFSKIFWRPGSGRGILENNITLTETLQPDGRVSCFEK
jgi:hypothetical protein